MELYEILILLLGLITAIGLDRVYRVFKDIQENGILNQVEYVLTDEALQNIIKIVLEELKNEKSNSESSEQKDV